MAGIHIYVENFLEEKLRSEAKKNNKKLSTLIKEKILKAEEKENENLKILNEIFDKNISKLDIKIQSKIEKKFDNFSVKVEQKIIENLTNFFENFTKKLKKLDIIVDNIAYEKDIIKLATYFTIYIKFLTEIMTKTMLDNQDDFQKLKEKIELKTRDEIKKYLKNIKEEF